jgi:hydroxyethylthiazole kinase
MKVQLKNRIAQAVEQVKKTTPMAGSITNTVTIDFVANAQIAVGGSAAMVYLPDEAEFLAQAGGAFYINTGTLLPVYEQTLPAVFRVLRDRNKPWALDPVAIGIGVLRTQLLQLCKEYKPPVIRGNASEILALAGLWGLDGGSESSNARGVDSTDPVLAAKDAAIALAKWTEGAVAVSGETDLVTDGQTLVFSHGGSHFMEKITGSGCALGGVMAVYASVASPFIAALAGTAVFNLAGREAGQKTDAPASFKTHFLDALYRAAPREIADNPFEVQLISEM